MSATIKPKSPAIPVAGCHALPPVGPMLERLKPGYRPGARQRVGGSSEGKGGRFSNGRAQRSVKRVLNAVSCVLFPDQTVQNNPVPVLEVNS